MEDYKGKTVVVTGGRGALGSALVEILINRGAICYVPARHQAATEDTGPALKVVSPVDLTEAAAVMDFFDRVPALWASFHAAGGFAMGRIEDTSVDVFTALFKRNAQTAFISCQEAIRAMRKTGQGGRIVNVIARPVLVPTPNMSAYSATKAAVSALTTSLAEEVAIEGIYINAVAPSIMNTPANRSAMPESDHSQWPTVMEVASVMADLGSPRNAVARGALVPVYGRA